MPLENGFILTSNRDERALRAQAQFPHNYQSNTGEVKFPRDGKAGGTWIAASKTKMICLLNGGFENHVKKSSYRHSRGKVVLDAFDYISFDDFRSNYDFLDLEPHTLVMIDFEDDLKLVELRWDGEKKHITKKSNIEPHIWSSVTLYTDDVIKKRQLWFKEWVTSHDFEVESIKEFHKTGGNGDTQNDFLMEREDSLKTISITSFEQNGAEINFLYEDLINKEISKETF